MALFIRPRLRVRPVLLALCAAAVLSGCASFSADGGFDRIQQAAQQQTGKRTTWMRSVQDIDSVAHSVNALLEKPLTVDDAVQIALLNNRALQARYSDLGIAEATLVQASRMPNPGFSFARTHGGDELKIDRSLTLSLMSLLTLPASTAIESRRFEQSKLLVAQSMLQTAADTRKAYYQAVASQQSLSYQEQVRLAAEIGHELSQGMASRGNFSQLDVAREQVFYADTQAQLTRMRKQANADREKLIRLLGLSGMAGTAQQPRANLRLPPRLPDTPALAATLQDVETTAMTQRLDIQAMKMEVDALATSLGLTQTTRFVNVLDLGLMRNAERGKAVENGYEISIEIPLFDWGGARVAKAESVYMQAVHTLAQTAIDARSQVRENYDGYLQAHALARQYRDQVVPLRKRISDEYMLRYNGMLISVFELLADAREQANAVNAAIDAEREFWIADADLQLALGAPLSAAGNHHERTQP